MSENKVPDISASDAVNSVSPRPSHDSLGAAFNRKSSSNTSRMSWLASAVVALLLICVLIGALFWFAQHRFDESVKTLGNQIQVVNNQLNDVQKELKLANLQVDSHTGRIAQLELSLREAQEQFESLDQAWQTFNNGMEDTMLVNDIERLLTLASQQLKLAGSANNAILALETALSELVRANRAEFSSLQRAINLDLERLRAAPVVDLSVLSARLESLITLTSRAPLLVPDGAIIPGKNPKSLNETQPALKGTDAESNTKLSSPAPLDPVNSAAPASKENESLLDSASRWTSRLRASIGSLGRSLFEMIFKDLSQLVSIQRVNDPNALLLSPEQGAQLRENLRARLLTAQLSLLMRQPTVWRDELILVEQILQSRFDPQSFDTLASINLVHELQALPVSASLPDLGGSFSALEAVRAAIARNVKEVQ
jgi:uroporphyrin-3 C-methyltransferase